MGHDNLHCLLYRLTEEVDLGEVGRTKIIAEWLIQDVEDVANRKEVALGWLLNTTGKFDGPYKLS